MTTKKGEKYLAHPETDGGAFRGSASFITTYLKNVFVAGELEENSVCSILEHTAEDGKKHKTKYYNLDAIISVGYRVNSAQATRFRIWATERLKEYMLKGFILDDERLKTAAISAGIISGNCWNESAPSEPVNGGSINR